MNRAPATPASRASAIAGAAGSRFDVSSGSKPGTTTDPSMPMTSARPSNLVWTPTKRSPKRASRSRAEASAAASRSRPIRWRPGKVSRRCSAWPPAPRVPSTTTAPVPSGEPTPVMPGSRRAVTRSRRTGTCPCSPDLRSPGAERISRTTSAPSSTPVTSLTSVIGTPSEISRCFRLPRSCVVRRARAQGPARPEPGIGEVHQGRFGQSPCGRSRPGRRGESYRTPNSESSSPSEKSSSCSAW